MRRERESSIKKICPEGFNELDSRFPGKREESSRCPRKFGQTGLNELDSRLPARVRTVSYNPEALF